MRAFRLLIAFALLLMSEATHAQDKPAIRDLVSIGAYRFDPSPLRATYALMKQLGPEIEFQTYHTTPKDFDRTIRLGVSYGASSIELWQDYGGFPHVPDTKLRERAALLERNTTTQ